MTKQYEKIKGYKDYLLNQKVAPSIISKNEKIFPNIKQTMQSSAYIITGKIISFLSSFLVIMALGKFVPRETAGSYNYIIAVLAIISITTLPGMNNALTRAVSKGYDGTIHFMIRKRLLWGLLGSFICFVVGIITWIKGDMTLGIAFLIAAPFVPLTDTFSNFAISFWQGKKKFDKSSLVGVIYYVGLAILSIPILILSDNLIIIIGWIMVTQAIMGFVIYIPIRKTSGTIDKESSKLGMHLTAIQILYIFSTNIDRVIVWHLLGPIMVAIYSFAINPISKAYRMIPIGTISLPHLSNQIFTKSVKNTVLRKTLMLFLLTIPVTIAIVFIAPFIYKIFFPLYPESVDYFKLAALSLVFSPVLLLKAALTAFNKTKALYINSIASPILRIVLMVILTTFLGLNGMLISFVVSTAFEFFLILITFIKTNTEKNPELTL